MTKIFKHTVTLPNGTVETRKSENRCYRWATIAVAHPGTLDVQIRHARNDLQIAEARLRAVAVPTPEMEAEYEDCIRQYNELSENRVSYNDPGYAAYERALRQARERRWTHPVHTYNNLREAVERGQAGLERVKASTPADFVIGYSAKRESAAARSTKWQERNGYATKVVPVAVEEHETKPRVNKSVPGTTKSHKAVLEVLPEVNVPVDLQTAEKSSGLTWRAFYRALRELREAGLVKSGTIDRKSVVVRLA